MPDPAGAPGRVPVRPDREILALALPAFATLVSEPLLVLADSAIIGHLSTVSLAGLGLAANVLGVVVGLSIFLAYGTTATVARRLGAGDRAGALSVGLDGMLLGLCIGIVAGVVLAVAAPAITGLYRASPQVHAQAAAYLRVCACGLPGALTILACTGVLRGLQDTRTPLYVAIVANLANIALNATLVYGVGLGIAGSGLGTAIAQTGAALWLATTVIRAAAAEGVRPRFHPRPVLAAARQGGWLLVRTACLQLAITVMTLIATRLGPVPLASHQLVLGLWNLLALALDAIAIAAQAIIGRALGAGELDRVRANGRRMIGWGVVAGLAFAGTLVAARPAYLGLFTADPQVRSLAAAVLVVFAVVAPVNGVVFVLDGVLIGAGDARYLALAGAVATAVYLPLAAAVRFGGGGLVWLWSAYCCYMLARLVTLVVRYRGGRWMRVGA